MGIKSSKASINNLKLGDSDDFRIKSDSLVIGKIDRVVLYMGYVVIRRI
jgi:hypothetical protein